MMVWGARRLAKRLSLWWSVPAIGLLFAACVTVLQQVDPQTVQALLPWLTEQTPRDVVIKRLGQSWTYRDDAGRILIYNVEPKGRNALRVRPAADPDRAYELVLAFDEQGRLDRVHLLKVK